MPSVGRGAQCGRQTAHSEVRDCQWIPPDRRWHHYGGAIPAYKCAASWVLHAKHAPGRAFRRKIARLDFNPRGVATKPLLDERHRRFISCRVAAATTTHHQGHDPLGKEWKNYDLLPTDAITSLNQVTNASIMSPRTCASFRPVRAGT